MGQELLKPRFEDVEVAPPPKALQHDMNAWRAQAFFYADSKPCTKQKLLQSTKCIFIALSQSSLPMSILFSNRAAARLKLGRFAAAAIDAGAALLLDSNNQKAGVRLLLALQELSVHPQIPFSESSPVAAVTSLPSSWWLSKPFIQGFYKHCDSTRPTKIASRVLQQSWLQVKEEGNVAFKASRFEEADEFYTQSIQKFESAETSIADLLANLAVGCVDVDQMDPRDPIYVQLGITAASCSLWIRPDNFNTWIQRLRLIERILHSADHAGLANYLNGALTDDALKNVSLVNEMKKKMQIVSKEQVTSTEEEKLHIQELRLKQRKSAFISIDVHREEAVAEIWESTQLVELVFGHKFTPLVDYRGEFLHHDKQWPPGIDFLTAEKFLNESYQQTRNLPHAVEAVFLEPDFRPYLESLTQRLGKTYDWYLNNTQLKLGDCRPLNPQFKQSRYIPTIRQNFSNQLYPMNWNFLQYGSTHVAIGFVDLGILSTLTMGISDADFSNPLKFIGYELSAYAVSKALVVSAMLSATVSEPLEHSQIRSVMQVWYSTTWDQATLQSFRSAVQSIRSSTEFQLIAAEVQEIINYWSTASGISLSEAREKWFQSNLASVNFPTANFLQKCDRVDMIRYSLTGDFGLTESTPHCASITWFDCPESTPMKCFDETVCFALNLYQTLAISKSENISFFKAADTIMFNRIKHLRRLCSIGAVVIDLRLKSVELSSEEIASLKPNTMSWSNVLDYFEPDEFHSLARKCSDLSGTVHFGYSMNWTEQIAGVEILDFPGPQHATLRKNLIDSSHKTIAATYRAFGVTDRLRCPPPVDANSITSYSLQLSLFKTWVDHFFDVAHRDNQICKVSNIEHDVFDPLHLFGGKTVFFSWTYEENISIPSFESSRALPCIFPPELLSGMLLFGPPKIDKPIPYCKVCRRTDVDLQQCGRCRKVKYCSEICQKFDWAFHKKVCQKNTLEKKK